MLAFLRAFASHEDPFQALAEGRFQAYVTAELFADL
jgi:ABC-type amino acid transport substrate-binding protein